MTVLSIRALHTRAGSFRLGPVDLTVPADRVLVVLGPSGAGKSILLTTIAGFRTPRSGRVMLDGRDITALPAEQRRIGLVFQDAALFPHMSVRDNVAFAPSLRGRGGRGGRGGRQHNRRADELLDRFGIIHLAARAPGSLSGGERQRVALARALAAHPAALLLDEPLSALDQPVREELREVLRDTLRELAVPALHVTHDRDEALRLADDLAILADGTLRQTGPAEHLAGHPTDTVTARLLGWYELGPVGRDTTGIHVGDLRITPATQDGNTGTAYYRPEEVLIDPSVQPSSPALCVRAQILDIERTIPLARVRLNTTPPLTALMLHRDLHRLPPPHSISVTVTLPQHALRIVAPSSRPGA